MTIPFARRVAHQPPRSAAARLRRCVWRQAAQAEACPDAPRLDGRLALVTGGARGIGLETSRGLRARGADVISASRRPGSASDALSFLALDLADLAVVSKALDALAGSLAGRRLDLLIANAGLWPQRYAESRQGHEIAFATNVLGHAALVAGALARDLLTPAARIVVVTGDIYILARACTSDYRYRGPLGGQRAYCRSKLGNLWYVRELARRRPGLEVYAVHPGVIASELSGSNRGPVGALKRALLLSPEQGAQTSLFCATQPELASGGYYHNVLGRMDLHADDPAADDRSARALWERLEELGAALPPA